MLKSDKASNRIGPHTAWRYRCVEAALLAAGLVIVGLWFVEQILVYEDGYRSRPNLLVAMFGFGLMLSVPCLILATFCHLLLSMRRVDRDRRRSVERAAMCFFLFLVFAIVGWFILSNYYPRTFTRGFRDRVADEIDLAALRDWHTERIRSPAPPDSMLAETSLPNDVRRLQPVFTNRYPDDSVEISWGSGFGHWGILIVPDDAPPPSGADYAALMHISPGIYAWHEQQ
jgi:hypothetical protein